MSILVELDHLPLDAPVPITRFEFIRKSMFNEKLLAKAGLIWLLMLGMAIWGVAVGRYEAFPFAPLKSVTDFFVFHEVHNGANPIQALTSHEQESPCQDCGPGGFTLHDSSFRDDGYLLLPRFSTPQYQKIVELVRLSDFQVIHTWVLDIDTFIDRWKPGTEPLFGTPGRFLGRHPFLLSNGDIVTHSGSPLACFDRNGKLKWLWSGEKGKIAHHSIEMDHRGNLVVTGVMAATRDEWCRRLPDEIVGAGGVNGPDGIAVVSPATGEIIEEYLVSDMLLENGYGALLFNNFRLPNDPLHINDAEPVLKDVGIMKQGDIVISLRSNSTVFIYRPTSKRIVWLRTGPWFHQHDPQVLPDGRIAILSNNSFPKLVQKHREASDVYIIDPATNEFEAPYQDILKKENVYTFEEGRSRILPNGDVVFEQTIGSRIVRLSRDKLIWEYLNCTRDGYAGNLSWSRYFLSSEIDLRWLDTPGEKNAE